MLGENPKKKNFEKKLRISKLSGSASPKGLTGWIYSTIDGLQVGLNIERGRPHNNTLYQFGCARKPRIRDSNSQVTHSLSLTTYMHVVFYGAGITRHPRPN